MVRIRPAALFIFLLFEGAAGLAQSLPLNPEGKSEWTEVVLAPGFSGSDLYANASAWLASLTRSGFKLDGLQRDSASRKLETDVEFPVYAQSGIFTKMSGVMRYHCSIETKDSKYRYSFRDFVFHYYKQDRNYKMVATGKTKPLEEEHAPGWQHLWAQHRTTTLTKVNLQSAEMRTRMVVVQTVAPEKETKKTEW